MRDPHEELLEGPAGHESEYRGLFVWPLSGADGRTRFVVSRMRQTHEGGMREFLDPESGAIVGSCGCNYAATWVKTVEAFVAEHT